MAKEAETLKKLLSNIEKHTASVGIIGPGHVGLPPMYEFSRAGFFVRSFDLDGRKVSPFPTRLNVLCSLPLSMPLRDTA